MTVQAATSRPILHEKAASRVVRRVAAATAAAATAMLELPRAAGAEQRISSRILGDPLINGSSDGCAMRHGQCRGRVRANLS